MQLYHRPENDDAEGDQPSAPDPLDAEGDQPSAPDPLDGYAGQPVLVGGDGGAHVVELTDALAALGYETPVSRGEADAILTDAVYAAVEDFRHDQGVTDELTRDGAIVGPATWAAIARASR